MKVTLALLCILAVSTSALIPTPAVTENKIGSNTTNTTNTTKPVLKSSFMLNENLNFDELSKTVDPPKLLTVAVTQPTSVTSLTQPAPVAATTTSSIPIKAEPTYSLVPAEKPLAITPPPPTLQGSYRLRLPLLPMRIRGNKIILSICNTHIFDIKTTPKSANVRITVKSSTEIACEDDYDKFYTGLLTQVTSLDSDESRIYFYKEKEMIAKASRKGSKFLQSSKNIDGKWDLQVINLALEVSDKVFSFQGCNTNVLDYKVTNKGDINLKYKYSTKKGCTVDNDRIFINALERSVFYETGEVSFTLYDKYGDDTAYGTPYLV